MRLDNCFFLFFFGCLYFDLKKGDLWTSPAASLKKSQYIFQLLLNGPLHLPCLYVYHLYLWLWKMQVHLDCWGPNFCKSRNEYDLPFAISLRFLFRFHFFSTRTADFTSRERDLFFQRGSLLMKPCQSLLPLPFVSQLATSAPITAAHGWLLEACVALSLSSSPCPQWSRLLGNLGLLCKKQEVLQHVLNHILTVFYKMKKRKSLPSAVGLLWTCQSNSLEKSITRFWCCNTVLYYKNMHTCILMCFNYVLIFVFSHRCQLSFRCPWHSKITSFWVYQLAFRFF